MKTHYSNFCFYYIFKIVILQFFSNSFFTLWRGLFHLNPFNAKALRIVISLISKFSNFFLRRVVIFVVLKNKFLVKLSRINISFSSSKIFFLPESGRLWILSFSFNCLLLIVLLDKPKLSNFSIFKWTFPFH